MLQIVQLGFVWFSPKQPLDNSRGNMLVQIDLNQVPRPRTRTLSPRPTCADEHFIKSLQPQSRPMCDATYVRSTNKPIIVKPDWTLTSRDDGSDGHWTTLPTLYESTLVQLPKADLAADRFL